jgi:hypothetical protein
MIDVDTFLTTLYVTVDEYDKAHPPPSRTPVPPGPAASLSRSEVVTLALFAQWVRFDSERAFYRYATQQLRTAFPGLPARSQFNRLLRHGAVQQLLVGVSQWLAERLAGGGCAYEVLDSTALVTRNAKRRGDGWLVGQADVGWSNRLGWYEGLHLLTVVTPDGVITGYGCAPASTADQRLAETVLAARIYPQPRLPEAGRPFGGGYYVADTNFEGKRWGPHWHHDYAAVVFCPPKRHQPWPIPWPRPLRRLFAGRREVVETVHHKLLVSCGLAQQRPHTLAGLRARLAAAVTLHNFCCWLNQHLGRPLLAFADLLDW